MKVASSPWPRRIIFGGAILILLISAAIPLGLRFSSSLLCVETRSMPASLDAIVLLGGDYGRRASRAVELYKAVPTARIFVVGDGDAEDVAILIKSKGVPEDRIVVEPKSQNTMQNARFAAPLLEKAGVKRAAIVTSWFHSRRAIACFQKTDPEIEFVSVPTIEDRPVNGWPMKGQRHTVFTEYLKLTAYLFIYAVWPF